MPHRLNGTHARSALNYECMIYAVRSSTPLPLPSAALRPFSHAIDCIIYEAKYFTSLAHWCVVCFGLHLRIGSVFQAWKWKGGEETVLPLPPIHSHATFSDWSCGRVVVVVGVSCLFIHAKGFISQADLGADNFVQKTDLRTECKYANLP